MFIIQWTYQAPLAEVDKYLSAHREFLDYYYKQGLFIASGPLKPRTGGIVIAVQMDKNKLEAILHKDPFYLAGIANYQLIEFTPIKHCQTLSSLIQETEGTLC